jgi:type III secretory pathway lipoprotein EscJ
MSELLSEIIIDLREESEILNCIRTSKIIIKDLIKNLKYDKIVIISDSDILIEDKRVEVLKDENKLEIEKKIINNRNSERIIRIIIYFLLIIILINNENIYIFLLIIILIIINDNLKEIIKFFSKEKIILE